MAVNKATRMRWQLSVLSFLAILLVDSEAFVSKDIQENRDLPLRSRGRPFYKAVPSFQPPILGWRNPVRALLQSPESAEAHLALPGSSYGADQLDPGSFLRGLYGGNEGESKESEEVAIRTAFSVLEYVQYLQQCLREDNTSRSDSGGADDPLLGPLWSPDPSTSFDCKAFADYQALLVEQIYDTEPAGGSSTQANVAGYSEGLVMVLVREEKDTTQIRITGTVDIDVPTGEKTSSDLEAEQEGFFAASDASAGEGWYSGTVTAVQQDDSRGADTQLEWYNVKKAVHQSALGNCTQELVEIEYDHIRDGIPMHHLGLTIVVSCPRSNLSTQLRPDEGGWGNDGSEGGLYGGFGGIDDDLEQEQLPSNSTLSDLSGGSSTGGSASNQTSTPWDKSGNVSVPAGADPLFNTTSVHHINATSSKEHPGPNRTSSPTKATNPGDADTSTAYGANGTSVQANGTQEGTSVNTTSTPALTLPPEEAFKNVTSFQTNSTSPEVGAANTTTPLANSTVPEEMATTNATLSPLNATTPNRVSFPPFQPPLPVFAWVQVGPWGSCSALCGNGTQQRSLVCEMPTGELASGLTCANAHDVEAIRPCMGTQCGEYAWQVTAWSECSRPCGDGVMTRDVSCLAPNGSLSKEYWPCNLLQRPATLKMCNLGPCDVYTWYVTSWGQCSAKCGGGAMTREVACVNQRQHKFPLDYCKGLLPPSTMPCNTHSCDPCDGNDCSGRGTCKEGVCTCQGGYQGTHCHVPPGCKSGVIDKSGVCCESGVVNYRGICQQVRTSNNMTLDAQGNVCPSGIVDVCGVCDGNATAVDIESTCTSQALDARGLACPPGVQVDDCGVCGGASNTCSLKLTMQFNISINGTEQVPVVLEQEIRSILRIPHGSNVTVTGVSINPMAPKVSSTTPRQTQRGLLGWRKLIKIGVPEVDYDLRSRPRGISPRWLISREGEEIFTADIMVYPIVQDDNLTLLSGALAEMMVERQALVKQMGNEAGQGTVATLVNENSMKVLTAYHEGVCGNGFCEVGERAIYVRDTNGELKEKETGCLQDCPFPFITCPSSDGVVCGGKGTCLPASGACRCHEGYTGNACDLCTAGYVLTVRDGQRLCLYDVVQRRAWAIPAEQDSLTDVVVSGSVPVGEGTSIVGPSTIGAGAVGGSDNRQQIAAGEINGDNGFIASEVPRGGSVGDGTTKRAAPSVASEVPLTPQSGSESKSDKFVYPTANAAVVGEGRDADNKPSISLGVAVVIAVAGCACLAFGTFIGFSIYRVSRHGGTRGGGAGSTGGDGFDLPVTNPCHTLTAPAPALTVHEIIENVHIQKLRSLQEKIQQSMAKNSQQHMQEEEPLVSRTRPQDNPTASTPVLVEGSPLPVVGPYVGANTSNIPSSLSTSSESLSKSPREEDATPEWPPSPLTSTPQPSKPSHTSSRFSYSNFTRVYNGTGLDFLTDESCDMGTAQLPIRFQPAHGDSPMVSSPSGRFTSSRGGSAAARYEVGHEQAAKSVPTTESDGLDLCIPTTVALSSLDDAQRRNAFVSESLGEENCPTTENTNDCGTALAGKETTIGAAKATHGPPSSVAPGSPPSGHMLLKTPPLAAARLGPVCGAGVKPQYSAMGLISTRDIMHRAAKLKPQNMEVYDVADEARTTAPPQLGEAQVEGAPEAQRGPADILGKSVSKVADAPVNISLSGKKAAGHNQASSALRRAAALKNSGSAVAQGGSKKKVAATTAKESTGIKTGATKSTSVKSSGGSASGRLLVPARQLMVAPTPAVREVPPAAESVSLSTIIEAPAATQGGATMDIVMAAEEALSANQDTAKPVSEPTSTALESKPALSGNGKSISPEDEPLIRATATVSSNATLAAADVTMKASQDDLAAAQWMASLRGSDRPRYPTRKTPPVGGGTRTSSQRQSSSGGGTQPRKKTPTGQSRTSPSTHASGVSAPTRASPSAPATGGSPAGPAVHTRVGGANRRQEAATGSQATTGPASSSSAREIPAAWTSTHKTSEVTRVQGGRKRHEELVAVEVSSSSVSSTEENARPRWV